MGDGFICVNGGRLMFALLVITTTLVGIASLAHLFLTTRGTYTATKTAKDNAWAALGNSALFIALLYAVIFWV